MTKEMFGIVIAFVVSFAVCVFAGPILIPILKRLKFGQKIREIGPKWHKEKNGIPTMGGLIFMAAVCVVSVIFLRNQTGMILLFLSLAFGAIGFVDDFIKVVMKRNLGLTAMQKLLLQILVSVAFALFGNYFNLFDTSILIPFTAIELDLGWFYYPLTVFVLIGGTNSVNLTDGLDGLAASVTAVVCMFFTIVGLYTNNLAVAMFSAAMTGGCVGFLIFNIHPAKVFMGDTGSLFLGGAVCAIAIYFKMHLYLLIVGGVYLIETLSVIIQVTSFKLTGKRVFKMSPIHHHFEMCGYSEMQIVSCAVIITAVLCVMGFVAFR